MMVSPFLTAAPLEPPSPLLAFGSFVLGPALGDTELCPREGTTREVASLGSDTLLLAGAETESRLMPEAPGPPRPAGSPWLG